MARFLAMRYFDTMIAVMSEELNTLLEYALSCKFIPLFNLIQK